MWQKLREELYPQGLEIVTIALDTDIDAARPWIEVAEPTHPSLIDQAHVVDTLFGIVNVPSGVWIDESGQIVRPPEMSYPQRPKIVEPSIPADASPEDTTRITEAHLAGNDVKKLRVDAADKYVSALRDWVAKGSTSQFALGPEEVLNRSRPRPVEEATAAAHFELGQHLHLAGRINDAISHFQEAYRLQPDNWTYKRQAWSLLDPGQDPLDVYGSDWASDVRKIGAENYYSPVDL